MTRMLSAKFSLHSIADVEHFCSRSLSTSLARSNMYLSPEQREEALAYLIAEAWWLAQRYDADRGISFSTYCGTYLPGRFKNWLSTQIGRAGSARARAEVVSLDGLRDRGGELGGALDLRSEHAQADCLAFGSGIFGA